MKLNIKWRLVIFVCLLAQAHRVSSSQEIMKNLTKGFASALDHCKQELSLGDHIMQDFFNYWREEYQLVNRELGCAIMCMAAKLELITDEKTLHHGNAHEFAKAHGADDGMAKQLVTMIHECERLHAEVADECLKTLEAAKCFRTKIHELKWAPSMETIIEELMTDM